MDSTRVGFRLVETDRDNTELDPFSRDGNSFLGSVELFISIQFIEITLLFS